MIYQLPPPLVSRKGSWFADRGRGWVRGSRSYPAALLCGKKGWGRGVQGERKRRGRGGWRTREKERPELGEGDDLDGKMRVGVGKGWADSSNVCDVSLHLVPLRSFSKVCFQARICFGAVLHSSESCFEISTGWYQKLPSRAQSHLSLWCDFFPYKNGSLTQEKWKYVHPKTYAWMFLAAWFIIAKKWKQKMNR